MAETTNKTIPPSSDAPGIGHNSGNEPSEARTSTIRVDADLVDVWPPNLAQYKEAVDSDLQEEVELLKLAGQRVPVIVRETSDGRFEAINRITNLAIVRQHNENCAGNPLKLEIAIHRITDEMAYLSVAQEQNPAISASSYSRGSFFASAVKKFATAKKAAASLKVSEATLSKSLDVFRAAQVLKGKVLISKDIAQRDAAWLMATIGRDPKGADAPNPEKRDDVLKAIIASDSAPAKAVFKALKMAAGDAPVRKSKAVHPLEYGGNPVGSLARGKAGQLTIKLQKVGDIEPQAIADLIRQAISDARASA